MLLNIIQTGTIRKLGCCFLFAFHSNYGRIFNRLRYSASKNSVALKKWVRGCLRSWKMAPFARPYTTFYWSVSPSLEIALSCTVLSNMTLNGPNTVTLKSGWEVTRGHSNVPFEISVCFLFAFHSNYCSMLRDKVRYWSKMAIFHTPCIPCPR